MPYTRKQKGLFGSEIARRERGEKPKLDMTMAELKEGVKAPTRKKKKGK